LLLLLSRVVVLLALRSSKLWSFYADLEESLGTIESACAVYDKMLDLRVATPQMILNYALMLQVRKRGGKMCEGEARGDRRGEGEQEGGCSW